MSDYIKRADLMAHIEEEHRHWGEDYDALQILGDIEDFPSADVDIPQWIPFNERFPDTEEQVLVNVIVKDAPWLIVLMRGKIAIDFCKKGQINAWMPLPEPFKEGEK